MGSRETLRVMLQPGKLPCAPFQPDASRHKLCGHGEQAVISHRATASDRNPQCGKQSPSEEYFRLSSLPVLAAFSLGFNNNTRNLQLEL